MSHCHKFPLLSAPLFPTNCCHFSLPVSPCLHPLAPAPTIAAAFRARGELTPVTLNICEFYRISKVKRVKWKMEFMDISGKLIFQLKSGF